MAADNMLRRWAMWVDGVGKAGNATSYTPPVINVRTTDFESGDMDMPVPIDDGMDPLEASFSIAGVDPATLVLFGFRSGGSLRVSARTTYDNRQGESKELVETLGGMITSIDRGEQGTGSQRDRAQAHTMKLDYYKVEFDGQTLIEIDPINGIRSLGGTDQLAGIKAAMGL